VREFAKYLEVWRVFDFLNYIPNMISVFEEVKKADKLLEPCICFSTGPEHTDEYYVSKVREILEVTGEDIILCIKNHGGLGTPARIGRLVAAIKQTFPDLIIHYHGHNTDGNDIGRILEAVKNGAKIVDAGDHAFTGFYGPPPILTEKNVWLTLILNLNIRDLTLLFRSINFLEGQWEVVWNRQRREDFCT